MDDRKLEEDITTLKASAQRLSVASEAERNRLLLALSDGLLRDWASIEEANRIDMQKAKDEGIAEALVKRLLFDPVKRDAALEGMHRIARLSDPVGKVLERRLLDEDLLLERISVPIGVIGMIFEARPDALVQIVSLCLKSGNGIILKGGREAVHTNRALIASMQKSASECDLGNKWFLLLESHEDVDGMLRMDRDIDLLIPRGSNAFVRYVMEHTSIPVLGHAAGICHMYVDREADVDMALRCAFDAKTQYPAACNAIETLLVHRDIAQTFLPRMAERFAEKKVRIHGDERCASLIDCIAYRDGDYDKEYLAQEINIRVVDDYEQAVRHIRVHGSSHTDAIITGNEALQRRFLLDVDSADVFVNCSTRFADGFRFGLGAEVGISTAKIHARGPVGLSGLMSSKWLLRGNGQVVETYGGSHPKPFLHRELEVEGKSMIEDSSHES